MTCRTSARCTSARFPRWVGAWAIVVFGLVDDLKNLGWVAKFSGQIVAALVVIFYGKVRICTFGECLPEGFILPNLLNIPLTLLVIVGVTNAINLADGLAGGISLLIFLCIGWLAYSGFNIPEKLFSIVLCSAAVGAIFGFLRFNTYPATVFMGDTGSQLLGFLAVSLSLGITQSSDALSPFLPLLLLGFSWPLPQLSGSLLLRPNAPAGGHDPSGACDRQSPGAVLAVTHRRDAQRKPKRRL